MSIYRNVAIIGVGLLGGSIGLALRKRGVAVKIVGVGRRQTSLDKALACGAISRGVTDLEAGVAEAELVVVATPVARIVEDVSRVLAAASKVLVTDVGSTKAEICAAIQTQAENAGRFVGSHPLAGDHRSGPENARADLLEGKTVVMTPTEATDKETTTAIQRFWQSLGAQVVLMAPDQHDQALAWSSHLPHLAASALAELTPAEWLPLAASGWADTTRVAAGDPELWTQIFAQNRPDLLTALDRFMAGLQQIHESLVTEDWADIQDFLAKAKQARDALGN
ncbi:MAG: prephenate dehydrogenase/arogenate dehydrogenase family protein [Pirellulales bacterium]|nr:prephenate dehydrogenase/arogenate dehydrogenase family protein [Pirellulales bacterium]